jgi:hypothetical protein
MQTKMQTAASFLNRRNKITKLKKHEIKLGLEFKRSKCNSSKGKGPPYTTIGCVLGEHATPAASRHASPLLHL